MSNENAYAEDNESAYYGRKHINYSNSILRLDDSRNTQSKPILTEEKFSFANDEFRSHRFVSRELVKASLEQCRELR